MGIASKADFSVAQAAALSGLTEKVLEHWNTSGFMRASVPAERRGVSKRYTFRDVVALRVVSELRRAGVSLQLLRKVIAYLRARDGLSATDVLSSTHLVTDGERVYEVSGDVTVQVPTGQRMMVYVTIPLDRVVKEVQRKARALQRVA